MNAKGNLSIRVITIVACLSILTSYGSSFYYRQHHYPVHQITVPVYRVAPHGEGKLIGTVKFRDSSYGLLIYPKLHGLTTGLHGLHIHEFPHCGNNGLDAGGHFDPTHTGKHAGPYRQGHLGDLPVLFVNQQGMAITPNLAPRVTLREIKGHSLVIHAMGDNYSDYPEKLGGGGGRIACGVIKLT